MWVFLLLAASFSVFAWFIFQHVKYKVNQTAGALESDLENSFIFLDIKKIVIIYFSVLLSLILVLSFVAPGIYIIVLMLVGFFLPTVATRIYNKKRLQTIEKQLPDALMMIAGGLKSGASLNSALNQLATEMPQPIKNEFSLIVREQKLGETIDQSFQNFQKRVPLNSTILAVTTIRIANETGGELAESLEKTADTLKKIEQAEGKIKALTSQGKMQAWVVGSMPLGLMLVLTQMEPEAMGQLWTTLPGWIALGAIFLCEVIGIWMILKIVNIDV